MKDPLPPKPRAAWQFYAEELIQKVRVRESVRVSVSVCVHARVLRKEEGERATNARDRLEGDDVAVRQLITDE
eukprot:scaffold58199_cov13-Tisochrysis_lutea.AAC.1